jgi:tripartite-type tricarboxylate transporter receptor subunit TctC
MSHRLFASAVRSMLFAVLATAAAIPAHAQYYKGKTLTMLINFGAGGPTDIEGRIFARFLPKHLAGEPSIVVADKPGAGGLIGVNYLGGGAVRPDGTTFGFFTMSPVPPIIDDPALKVKYSDFAFIAGVSQVTVAYGRKDIPPGISRPADMAKARDVFGAGYNPANDHDITMMQTLSMMGARFKIVSGFRSANDGNKALMQKEVNFNTSSMPGYQSQVVPNIIKTGIAIPLWYMPIAKTDGTYVKSALMESQGVHAFSEVYREAFGKLPSGPTWETFVLVNNLASTLRRSILLPKASPKAAIDELRKAFVDLIADPAFVKEYERVVQVKPEMVSASDGQALVDSLSHIDPAVKADLKKVAGIK